jgi:hypothetical protein
MPEEKKDMEIRIRCCRSTFIAFKKYAAEYKTYEDALLSLLAKVGIYPKKFELR